MLKMSEGANFRDKVKRKVKQENVFRQPNHVEVEKRFGIGRTDQLTRVQDYGERVFWLFGNGQFFTLTVHLFCCQIHKSLVQIESQSNLGQAEAVELYVFGQRRQI